MSAASTPFIRRYSPALGTAGVAVLWGTSGVLVRESALSAVAIAFGRAAVGAAALLLWEAVTPRGRGRASIRSYGKPAVHSLLWSGALLAVHWLTFVMALQRAPIGTVLLGIYLAPLAIAGLAHRTLQEHVTRGQVASLALALVGSVFVLQPGQTGGLGGLALIAVSALAYAGSTLASKKALSTVPIVGVTTGQLAVAAVLLMPWLAVHPKLPSGVDVLVIASLGLVYSALALLAYLAFLKRLPVTTSGILLYLEPVSALVAGWIFLGEHPVPPTWLGACLVLVAGIMVSKDSVSNAQTEAG
ncbi:DMT family transporter [Streptomyces coacervatus]|uniref:DMT family transporter n=1 Tax=Streptomyces coacervatus TaxID=647381 RepID=A0ABP7JJS9_9ACTN|nr:EamA family transporter [Streptomyces coacervatus]MDF2272633.1 EamA family transporter [Streptomyces coacervatus]